MTIEYRNRFGDTYFLQAGKTKTDKPKYYFGKKLTAAPVETLPEGFEIRESPDTGLVTLRKCRPTEISPLEKQMLSDGVRAYAKLNHFIVDVDGNSLIVYLPDMQEQEALRLVGMLNDRMGSLCFFGKQACQRAYSSIALFAHDAVYAGRFRGTTVWIGAMVFSRFHRRMVSFGRSRPAAETHREICKTPGKRELFST